MKTIFEFMNEQKVVMDGEVTNMSKAQISNLKGKSADENGSDGGFDVEAPTEDDLNWDLDLKSVHRNTRLVYSKLKIGEPFFVQGRAGWGKTTVIEKVAKKLGYSIITVYLDKAVATDLGGIPTPVQTKNGGAARQDLMPPWAAYMYDRPNEKFLLFFDEMNQASPDVMDALMPIILKKRIADRQFHNYVVGCAGNFRSENVACEDLNGPLKSRLKPYIIWETGTEASWNSAFEILHSKWDDKLGAKFVDSFHNNCMAFENPREIEMKVFEFVYNHIKDGDDLSWMPIEDIEERMEELKCESTDTRYSESKRDETIKKMTEYVYKYMQEGGKAKETEKKHTSRRGNGTGLPQESIDSIVSCLSTGSIKLKNSKTGEKKTLGLSLENIWQIVANADDTPVTAEQIEAVKKHLKTIKAKVKYETNEDFLKLHPSWATEYNEKEDEAI